MQLRSGTIWATNASVQHDAMQKAPHTRLHCMRSKVLWELRGGVGGPAAPQGCAVHPVLGAMPRRWAELTVLGWLISCPFFPLGLGCGEWINSVHWRASRASQLWKEDKGSCLVPIGSWHRSRTMYLPVSS